MKLDKQTILMLSALTLLLLAWPFIFPTKKKVSGSATSDLVLKNKSTFSSGENIAKPEVKETFPEKKAVAPEVKTAIPEIPAVKKDNIKEFPIITISNEFVRVSIDPNKGALSFVELKKFLKYDKNSPIMLNKGVDALAVSGAGQWRLLSATPEDNGNDSFSLSRIFEKNGGKFKIIQSWKLDVDYRILYKVKIMNISETAMLFNGFQVNAGAIPPLTHLAGDVARREYHYISAYMEESGKVKDIDTREGETEREFEKKSFNSPLKWLAVSNKYFASVLLPEKGFENGVKVFRKARTVSEKSKTPQLFKMLGFGGGDGNKEYYILGAYGKFKPFSLQPGSERVFSFKYYSGPKEISYLEKLTPSATKIMNLFFAWTWPVFNLFAKLLEGLSQTLLALLIYFKHLTGSYGIGIILLTIIVRAAVWPFTQKANKSMKRMQKLQPLVQELKEKYKDNQQLMNQKLMLLYKEHKVNPLGGCLPILLQFPVFLALYCTIEGAVVLRQSSFLWCVDLCQPDNIGTIAGINIHPLIIVMTLLMAFQQKITPSAADPMQQKMMMIMPLFMLLFLYNLPSGLTLYWTVSQFISIIQLVINNRLNNKEEEKAGAAA